MNFLFEDASLGSIFLFGIIIVLLLLYIPFIMKYKDKVKELSRIKKFFLFDNVTELPNEYFFKENYKYKNQSFYLLDCKHEKQLKRAYGQKSLDIAMKGIVSPLKKLVEEKDLQLYKYKEFGFLIVSKKVEVLDGLDENILELFSQFNQSVTIFGNKCPIDFWISTYNTTVTEVVDDIIDKLEAGIILHKRNKDSSLYCNIDIEMYENFMEINGFEKELFSMNIEENVIPYYQLKYDISSNKVIGCEALARIIHPKRGVMSPDSFIPFFEEIKQIDRVDVAIFKKVCEDVSEWFSRDLLAEDFRVSVNFSSYTIENIDMLELFSSVVEKTGIKYTALDLELTETLETENMALVAKRLKALSELGVIISLDDFFAGHSNFERINMLPVNNLKLDKTFLEESLKSNNLELIKSIKTFTESNNLSLIVEGVETEEHIRFLKEIGINLVQGYYYSKPLSKESLEDTPFNNKI
ncbi:MAG: GGDEF domain-containing phosphodiesterase [Lachnospirales bacterium]